MTLGRLLREGKSVLLAAGVEDWEADAWYLLEYAAGCSRKDYFLNPEKEADEADEARYRELLRKRSRHVPLQHLTGSQDFMGCSFLVNEDVLIPRQDTEVLVEEALRHIRPGMKILDLCTGSGCILLSILKLIPGVSGIGTDISGRALLVAERNRTALGIEAEFRQSDLFERVEGSFDCILSNPPYISTGVIDTLAEEVRVHEPRLALDGREDGLYFYRKITAAGPRHLKPGGMLFLEIGYDQAEPVVGMMNERFADIHFVKDLSGLDRVVYGHLR